jgi:transcriptional regulator with XRE-family HTH domain
MQDSGRIEPVAVNQEGIGQRVKTARIRKGWKREALAYHAGLSWAAVTQIESGRRKNLRQATLVALAESLEVTIDYLICGRSPGPILDHRVLVYDGPEQFVREVAPFLVDGLDRGEAALAVTSQANLRRLRHELGDASNRVNLAHNRTWYRTPTVAFGRYQAFADESVAAGARWLRVVGEPVWAGRSRSEIHRWAQYESILNLAFADVPMTLVCPYDTRTVTDEILALARATHPSTHEDQSRRESRRYIEPTDFILKPPMAGPPR